MKQSACPHPAHALTDLRRLGTRAGSDPVDVARCDPDRGGCGERDVPLGVEASRASPDRGRAATPEIGRAHV